MKDNFLPDIRKYDIITGYRADDSYFSFAQDFVAVMDEKLKLYYKDTNLKRLRQNAGYSQKQLAEEAGVPIRQIQLFEQRRRDINKTQLETVVRLSKALGCRIEELVELL